MLQGKPCPARVGLSYLAGREALAKSERVGGSNSKQNHFMSIPDTTNLENLNPQQFEAVTLPLGPALVLAGPGSGKTRVLTHRLIYLVHEMGIPQWNILAVTFTNKAAKEMKARVQEQMQDLPDQASIRSSLYGSTPTVGTFHSICARILRIEFEYTPYDRNWVIFDRQDQSQVISAILKETGEQGFTPFELRQSISRFKNRGILPNQTALMRKSTDNPRLEKLYLMYQNRLQESNGMDFDDLLMYTRILLQDIEEVRRKYQHRWSHILVDEFQDTNHVQYDLLQLLMKFEDSQQDIFAVGDEDQSIYAFRGADYENVNRFRKDFRDCRTVLLEQNYRSTPQILTVANGLISNNRARAPKRLFTTKESGQRPIILAASDTWHEAEWICSSVTSLLQQSSFGLEDMAVMYRTNAQSRELEEAFLRASTPYRIVGALRFYDRREVKDALAYLRLVVNPRDRTSLMRIINRPTRGIGRVTLDRLLECASRWRMSLTGALHLIANGPEGADQETIQLYYLYPHGLKGRALKALQRFSGLLQNWTMVLDRDGQDGVPDNLLVQILTESGYYASLDDSKEDETSRKENLDELVAIATEFAELEDEPDEEQPQTPIERFLAHVSLHAGQDELEEEEDKVTLMTLHTSKGLEFPVVYIAGLDEEMLPHSRSVRNGSSKEIEEERRTFYVGVTRAQELLFLTFPAQRFDRGQNRLCEPSRFLEEIPSGSCQEDRYPDWWRSASLYRTVRNYSSGVKPLRQRTRNSAFDWSSLDQPKQVISKPAEAQFKAAMKVVHPTFGKGMVIGSVIKNGEEEVSIMFEGHGPKKLLASIANLKTP